MHRTLSVLLLVFVVAGCHSRLSRMAAVPRAAEAVLFGDGIISTGEANDELFPSFTPDGQTLYFVRRAPEGRFTIFQSNLKDGRWTAPMVASFSGTYSDQEPYVAPDGLRLFFTSNRPIDGEEPIAGRDVWMVERTEAGWGEPGHVGAPISLSPPPADAENRFLGLARGPRVDESGTLYFWADRPGEGYGATDLYRSRLEGGRYTAPENMGAPINTEHYETGMVIAPGGQMLFLSRDCPDCEGSYGASDLYVSYLDGGSWTVPKNLGPRVNSPAYDFGPVLSPDGRYLFFSSNRGPDGVGRQNIYYVDLNALDLSR